MRHIPTLTIVSHQEISNAFDAVKAWLPSNAEPIIQWFEMNYAHGQVKRTCNNMTTLELLRAIDHKFLL